MKAQGMPSTQVILIILVVIGIAAGVIFLFTGVIPTEQTETSTNQSKEETSRITLLLQKQKADFRCNNKCSRAQSAVYSLNNFNTTSISEFCATGKLKNSEFCDDTYEYGATSEHCDVFYTNTGQDDKCIIKFPNTPPICKKITCSGATEGCAAATCP